MPGDHCPYITRRTFIMGTGALAASAVIPSGDLLSQDRTPLTRAIPSSGELLPIMGMGTSGTFDVGHDPAIRAQLAEVVRIFFEKGGKLIDTSPMYGRAESVVGDLLTITGKRDVVFAATKVWTDGRQQGVEQMQRSKQRLRVQVIDLMQIHNLRDWQTHLPVLRQWKYQGLFRYIGITTSHGRDHKELARIMETEQLDFVQFTYNIQERNAETRLLPLAADRGMATLINRPFQRGQLFRRVNGAALPEWSTELGCRTWGQYFLKFIAGHPAVTCVIPATSRTYHMKDNMEAGFGTLPDAALRQRMIKHFESL